MDWPWSSTQQQLCIDYWLPITKVNVTGTVVSATTSYGDAGTNPDPVKKATPAVVSIVTRPDYSEPCHLNVLAGEWAERKAKLGLLPDGRLTSADTSAQDDHGEGLKAALTLAALGAGAGGAFGPAGAVIGAGIGFTAAELETRRATGEGRTDEAIRTESEEDSSGAGTPPALDPQPPAGSEPDTKINPGYASHDCALACLYVDLHVANHAHVVTSVWRPLSGSIQRVICG